MRHTTRVTTRPIALGLLAERRFNRRGEPVRFGVPFAKGVLRSPAHIQLQTSNGGGFPTVARPLEHWPDGSVRWALCDACVTADWTRTGLSLAIDDHQTPPSSALRISKAEADISVDTGALRMTVGSDGASFSVKTHGDLPLVTNLLCVDSNGSRLVDRVTSLNVEEGPLRSEILVAGHFVEEPHLHFTVRLAFFAELSTIGVDVAITNTRRATHPDGYWDLGDPASVLLEELALVVRFTDEIDSALVSLETRDALESVALPLQIYQESSGGAGWRNSLHQTRDGVVPMQLPGYEVRSQGAVLRSGKRATPVLVAQCGERRFAATIPHFWQEFPKELRVEHDTLSIGLLPGAFPVPHELQGGERKTHRCHLSFGPDSVTDIPLDWCRDPLIVSASPGHFVNAGAVPYLTVPTPKTAPYDALVEAAVEGSSSFAQKCERADEYGWRHFGDLYADHETVRQAAGSTIATHYNNQYDGIAGAAVQFMRFGDPRWWRLSDELARHVIDIDLYHTREDKAAYNGGLFWHTYHYVDAGLSTHRCYSRMTAPHGGGPSNEHNYTTGLMLHYLLTGHVPSRDAVVQLAEWVLHMDDGRLTPLRWLSSRPTGLASSTVSSDYHGPGRGAANSINALLDAHRLTSEARYLDKAEELIRRCVHPRDDVEARGLLDTERRWSYTVFLQTLGKYLDYKAGLGQIDEMYAYAQTALVAYASWMAEHEYPYLEKPEKLEFPTETWAAQDMRKSEVFRIAACHAPPLRERFVERSRFFYESSLSTLTTSPTRSVARPLVLLMSNGYQHGTMDGSGNGTATIAEWHGASRPETFVTQKTAARRTLALLIAAAVCMALVASTLLIF